MTTELRELMASAADDQPPHDLAGRAMAGARRRRQGRLVVAGSIAAVTVLVAAAVAFGPMQRTNDEPRPQDVALLPAELPGAEGLRELAAGTMDRASVAYVVDDRLVLVDENSADAAVWNPVPKGIDITSKKVNAALPYQVRLSPDGTTALVAMRFETSQRLLGIRLMLLDVASAQPTPVEDLRLTDAYAESAWLEYNLMTWAPSSQTVYCVCIGAGGTDPDLGIWAIEPDVDPGNGYGVRQVSALVPSQISAGAAGLVVQLEPMLQPTGGPWSLLSGSDDLTRTRAHADALAASLDDPSAFALTRDGRYGLTSDSPLYPEKVSGPLPAGPVSSIQSLRSDVFVLVSRPEGAFAGEPAPPSRLLAHLLAKGSDPQLITTFPSGTTSTSFAAGVDTVP